MTRVAVPTYSTRKARKLWWLAPAVALLALGAYWLSLQMGNSSTAPLASGPTFTVQPLNMDIRVVKDGDLQAVNNIDIINTVEGQTTIQELVKEGASVKKGDVLAQLDSSQIKQKIEDTTLDLQKGTADLTTAHELRDIQISQNAANIEAAEVALTLAKLDLQQYVDGSYPQQLGNARTDVKMADTTLKNRQDDLDQTRGLFGRGFVTAADVKKADLEVINAQNALDKANTALMVLSKYTHEMDLASKKNALAQAEQKLARTLKENASNLAQKEADVSAKDQSQQLLKRRLARLNDQLAACTVKAPADGMVVYASTGDRNADKPIQEGTTVRERQLLLRVPDTSSMKVVLRIQEGQVGKLHEGMRAVVHLANIAALAGGTLSKISLLPDNAQRWWNPDSKEFIVDVTLDETPPGLKPSTGAQAEIYVDRLKDVLAVPLSTLYAAGADTYVFQITAEGPKPIKVQLGQSNETHVEIKEGVSAGQQLVLLQSGQGRELLERAGIKPKPVQDSGPSAPEKKKNRKKDAVG